MKGGESFEGITVEAPEKIGDKQSAGKLGM